MKLRAVLTDLDGTVLEPDGSLLPEAVAAWHELAAAGAVVCPVTSKTAAEVALFLAGLGVASPAGGENGGVVIAADGTVELAPAAVAVVELERVVASLRAQTGAPIESFLELPDARLEALTGLRGAAVAAARSRVATLPLLVDRAWDDALGAALAAAASLRLVRGNRFLHLQGRHDKADVVPRLLALVGPGPGRVVACGDAANDLELLRAADIRIIVPGSSGPDPALVAAIPDAVVAPWPHGRGWAGALVELVRRSD